QVRGKGHLSDNSSFDERTRQILSKSNVPVGVLVDKGLEKIEKVFIPIFSVKDIFLISFAQKLISNTSAQVTILDAAGKIKQHPEIKESIRAIEQIAPNHIELLSERGIAKDILNSKDLTLISIDSWKKSEDSKSLWLSELPSSLILTDGV
ncbi:MAG TPA: cation/H(+) antiporter, partial [Chryseolinea sp.]|nr:cation/H(+) antiporter [Chryseolinea sp.]